ncbi:host specificity protein J [Vibrio phage SHOU24]|uniref:tail fiber protein n=1 Tax=Vibrio phage SHOU24 TaxID=1414739 RepID=UPI0003ED1BED|nr:tail fiber protein [Vibrio phage SHOU24]AHI61253.1 host specificity protein J [Vibrio phage SHOU24]
MPPVIIGVAVGVAASVAGATLLTAVAIGMAAAGLYAVATMDIPKTPGTSPSNAKQTIRSPNQPFRAIVGTAMVGGPMLFAEEYSNSIDVQEEYEHCTYYHGGKHCEKRTRTVTKTNKYLHLVIPLACHPCEDVVEVYFGDDKQDNWDHEYWKINVIKGDQQSVADLPKMLTDVPSWTDKMVGKGVTFVHVALRHSAEHFPNGLPNIKCLVQGMKLDTPMFKGFTNNAAAVVYHFLRHHFRAKESEINTLSFRDAYSVCGELMYSEQPAPDPDDPSAPTPAVPIRYAIDGIYDFDESYENIMNKMLAACGGKLLYTNGQYHLHVAAYRGPAPQDQVVKLSDLNGPIQIVPDTPLGDRINTVKGQHLDPNNFYQQVDFEPVTHPDYVAEDGEELTKDLDLEYVLNPHQAYRLANIVLKENRYGLTVTVPMNLRGFKFNAGLPVRFDEKEFGYDQLEFEVASWKLTDGKGIELVLKQTAAEIFDDAVAVVTPKPPSTNIPDPKFCHPVQNLIFQPFLDDGVYDGLLLWSHPDIDNVREFEVVVTSTDGQIFKYQPGKALELYLDNMPKSDYNITVIGYNIYGAPSAPVSIQADIGSTKPITNVVFEADNFEMNIIPKVSGILPSNTTFLFYRANNVNNPSPTDVTLLGQGVTYVDVGLIPNTAYKYYVQVTNSATFSELYGPYSAKTTDNPDDIYDFIKDQIPGQYTWVVYASDAFGADISKTYNPAIHHFEGRAYNKGTETPSLNPLDYTFIRIGEFISPEDQDILDNLAQGKLPDGSADLVKPSDVLFKPGDKVTGTNIADGAISTPKLTANAVTSDKIIANAVTTAKIAAGAVTATQIAANAITASKILAGAITAEKIAANAITADKIAVTVVSPINNFSEFGDTRGWLLPPSAVLSEAISLNGKKARTLKFVNSPTAYRELKSDKFTVDHNAIYEVRFSYYSGQTSQGVKTALRLKAYNSANSEVVSDRYHFDTLAKADTTPSPDFWAGSVVNGWRHLVSYIVGASADVNSVPKAINSTYVIKLGADARTLALQSITWPNANIVDTHIYSPSIVKVGSGIIVANEIRANSLITSPVIKGGTVEGVEVIGSTVKGGKGLFGPESGAPYEGHHTRIGTDGTIDTDRLRLNHGKTGSRLEITADAVRVYEGSLLRVVLGKLS